MHLRRQAGWLALAVPLAVGFVVLRWVDLSPRVERDFFFAPDDPQIKASIEIERAFPQSPQLIVRVEGADTGDVAYRAAVSRLTAAFQAIPGVRGVNSITTEDAQPSPLWRRVLLTPSPGASNILLRIDSTEQARTVRAVEAAIRDNGSAGVTINASGVPLVIELIRRNLLSDLIVFSTAAFLVFGLLVGFVYRDVWIVAGTLSSAVVAAGVTLLLSNALGISIGLLTANIATIVFVLTLSHIVFLTANWRGIGKGLLATGPVGDPVRGAVTVTFTPSFWSMFTTFLGFGSLLIASARPLRELGTAGAIGAVVAMATAYLFYPLFLRGATPAVQRGDGGGEVEEPTHTAWLPGRAGGFAVLAAAVVIGAGLAHVNTDPPLLSYFAAGSELRDGLELIDRDGGSSTLNIVVADTSGARVDSRAMYERMWQFQDLLEADRAVGSALSPAVLLAHAKTAPFAGFLSFGALLRILDSPAFDRVAASFVSPDRKTGLFFVRMRESVVEPRSEVIERLRGYAASSGLRVVQLGGVYDLERQLGELIRASLVRGLGGLMLLFLIISFVVSRNVRAAGQMFLFLVPIPLVVLGVMGWLRSPIDMIAAPAANVALAMGVDSMIHVVVRARKLAGPGRSPFAALGPAVTQLRGAVIGAALIISAGFGVFGLSTFPPTRRFGLLVILGTLTAAVVTLIGLASRARGSVSDRPT